MKKGSFTVEAAFLMTILIPLLLALIYLGFYMHDSTWIKGAAYEAAVEVALQGEDGTLSDSLTTGARVQKSVQNGKKEVSVNLSESFRIPGLAAQFFGNGSIELSANGTCKIIDARKRIMQIKAVKSLGHGGEK